MTEVGDRLAAEAADPRIDPARLAELAAAHRHLHPLIAANPACYPGLLEWMRQFGPIEEHRPGSASVGTAPQPAALSAAQRQVFGAPVEQGLLERAYTPVVDEGDRRRKRTRKRVLWTALGIALSLVVVAGGVFGVLYASGTVLGGRSPEQAAERFALGLGNADPLVVLGSAAPSEAAHLRAPVEQLLDLDLGPAGTGGEAAAALRSALSLRFEGAEHSVEALGDGIALVEPRAGSAVLDGDPAELAGILTRLAEPALRAGVDVPLLPDPAAASEGSPAEEAPETELEPDVAVDEFRSATEARLADRLPATIDLAGEEADGFAVVAVEEGTGWYASPMLTAAELAYRALGDGAPPRGEVRDTADLPRYDTPLLAAEALSTGIVAAVQGDGLGVAAAALSLPERRLVEIYGEALIAPGLPQVQLELVESALTAAEPSSGEDAVIGGSLELLLDGMPLQLGGGCATLERQPDERVERCLGDSPLLDGLGAGDWHPVAVPENGGWRVGGLATLGDALGISIERYGQLVAAGEVDRLADG